MSVYHKRLLLVFSKYVSFDSCAQIVYMMSVLIQSVVHLTNNHSILDSNPNFFNGSLVVVYNIYCVMFIKISWEQCSYHKHESLKEDDLIKETRDVPKYLERVKMEQFTQKSTHSLDNGKVSRSFLFHKTYLELHNRTVLQCSCVWSSWGLIIIKKMKLLHTSHLL